ncbi:MAG: hypothetical protein IJZ83_01940 [Clostridia bacterium]|nr:hypothetical protein [Clostridia bacterium]
MKKYISPEYTVLCISAEDVMAINSSAYLNMDEATDGYGTMRWPFGENA